MAFALFFFPHSAQYAEYRYCALAALELQNRIPKPELGNE